MKDLWMALALFSQILTAQSLLVRTDSIKLPQANIWGGISYNGENISVTTTFTQTRAHLYLRKLDTVLQQIGALTQLTFDSDSVTAKHITDHKNLFLNGYHFIAFSVAGDSDLYVFKADKNGSRIGEIAPVVEHTADRTNDMMFGSDGNKLYAAYFRPPQQSVIHTLDQNLAQIAPPLVTSMQLPHNNLGTMFFQGEKFFMFTGDKAGPNSNLILTVWNSDWSPGITLPKMLIQTNSGEGLAFPTGIAYDSTFRRWYVGFHHMKNINPDATTHIDFAVFDENFVLLEQQHHSDGFRPHFLLLDNSLYSIYDMNGVFLERYRVQRGAEPHSPDWKQFFTLAPSEGTEFIYDTTSLMPGGGVPVIGITSSNDILLSYSGSGQPGSFFVRNNGTIYDQRGIGPAHGPDGSFVYMPDGKIRFFGEIPSAGNTQQQHKSHMESWISTDGLAWTKESGIRYQPGTADDSISSVASLAQVKDSVWRMYYVGDFYRTNGARTAISTDWGWTWTSESNSNILRRGDVDPQPVYLTDGGIRLYHRTGFNMPGSAKSGVAFTDSEDGLHFDTLTTTLIIADTVGDGMMKLDPSVIRFGDGSVLCYIGSAPGMNQPLQPKLTIARAKKVVRVTHEKTSEPSKFALAQNYPNPFNPSTVISYHLPAGQAGLPVNSLVTLKIYDMLGREVTTLVNEEQSAGWKEVEWNAIDVSRQNTGGLASGIYFYRIDAVGNGRVFSEVKKLAVVK
jgi:hypothetical protein